MPCPSHSWYRLSHFLKTQHWSPDCSWNCCYTKFQSENKVLTKEQNFQEWMQAAINVTSGLSGSQQKDTQSTSNHNQIQNIMLYISLNTEHKWVFTKLCGCDLHCSEYMHQFSWPCFKSFLHDAVHGISNVHLQLEASQTVVVYKERERFVIRQHNSAHHRNRTESA
jgi:hypothetical protein